MYNHRQNISEVMLIRDLAGVESTTSDVRRPVSVTTDVRSHHTTPRPQLSQLQSWKTILAITW